MGVGVERIGGKRRLVVDRTVDVPADVVWEVLVDTERWPEWGPSVSAVECDERHIQAGTVGRVRTPIGLALPFEITACETYRWTWRVAGVPATGHRIEALGPDRCRVSFDLSPLAAGYVPICQRALERIARLAHADAESVTPSA